MEHEKDGSIAVYCSFHVVEKLSKWKSCRKRVRENGALGGDSREKPGRRSPKVEE